MGILLRATASLAHNASLSTIQAALNATTAHAGDITISGDYTHGFLLTFSSSVYTGTVAQVSVDDSDLPEFTSGLAIASRIGLVSADVQTITLSAYLIGGTWSMNGGGALAYNASAATVQSYLESLLGQTLTVTGDAGGPYTVIGARPLLTVASIDLIAHDGVTVSTLQAGGATFTAHMAYGSFGNLLSAVDGDSNPIDITALTRYLYTSREFDAATGLQYNRARWFDQVTGSRTSVNPMSFVAGDGNLYRYVNNGPTDGTDPSGLDIYLTYRKVAGVDIIPATQKFHLAILIIPNDQDKWKNDSRFEPTAEIFCVTKHYVTLSSGPEGGKNFSRLNREQDAYGKNFLLARYTFDNNDVENAVIDVLLKADGNYRDDLDYFPVPTSAGPKYNSNSYVAGLMGVAKLKAPDTYGQNKEAFPGTDFPGFKKPIPEKYFKPGQE